MLVFISDVHLNEPCDANYKAFLQFLDQVTQNSQVKKVFLLGDIFDVWVGDKKVFKTLHAPALEKFKVLCTKKEVHYVEGNHDFLLSRKFWEEDIGLHLHKSHYQFQHKGQRWYVEHGDLLNPGDHGYLWLRWFLRSWFAQMLVCVLPGSLILKIGQSWSSTGQKPHLEPSSKVRAQFKKQFESWIQEKQKHQKFDAFVCGHFHIKLSTFNACVLQAGCQKPFENAAQYFD